MTTMFCMRWSCVSPTGTVPQPPSKATRTSRRILSIVFSGRILAERESAGAPFNMMTHKETFLREPCTHIATHTRHWERQGWRLLAFTPSDDLLGRRYSL